MNKPESAYPIRVLNLFCELNRGGAETFVMSVYRKIDRSKVQFDFLVFGSSVGAYEKEIESLGGKIFHIPPVGISTSRQHRLAARGFFRSHPEYRIIHSHVSELGTIAFREAARLGVPIRICHAHSAPNAWTWKTPIRFIFKKAMLLWTNECLACSEVAGAWQYGNREFRVIKNGIDTDLFAYSPSSRTQYREAFGLNNKFVIGHVGRFEEPKNHEFLVKVFKRVLVLCPEAVLVMVGDGSLRTQIEEELAKEKSESKALFLGVRDDINSLLQLFDVFVFPSKHEGLGIALIEAQCSGLKCLASQSVPAEANPTGLVEYLPLTDVGIWADAIMRASKEYIRTSYSKSLASAGYDIECSSSQLQELYLKRYGKS